MRFKFFGILLLISGTAACTHNASSGDEFIVGKPLKSISYTNNQMSDDGSEISIFDKTTRKIHQFRLQPMTYKRSFEVLQSEQNHYVLAHSDGNYVIDFSEKNLSIFNQEGLAQHQPIQLQGIPVSAAYHQGQGILVVYDDMASVGIIKLDSKGNVIATWVGGPILSNTSSISAGDINDQGQLILSLSDKSLAVVDIAQTLAEKKWVFTSFATGLNNISWLAPLPQNGNHVLIKSRDKISLLELSTQKMISERSMDYDNPIFVEKSTDPHVILGSGSSFKLIYADNGQIQEKTLSGKISDRFILNSRLNLKADSWTLIDSSGYEILGFGSYDRKIRRFRVSDLLATQSKSLPDQAQLELMVNSVFALFPSELGYAVRYNIERDEKAELKLFNLDHIR